MKEINRTFKKNHKSRLLVTLSTAFAVLILGLIISWFKVLNYDLSEAAASANKAVENINILLDQAALGADDASSFLNENCSTDISQSLNKIAINLPNIRIITMIHHGWMTCSSLYTLPYKVDFSAYVDQRLQIAPDRIILSKIPIMILLKKYPKGLISVSVNTSYISDLLTRLSTHRTLILLVGDRILTGKSESSPPDKVSLDEYIINKSSRYPFEISYEGSDSIPIKIYLEKGMNLIGLFFILSIFASWFVWRYLFRVVTPSTILEMAIKRGDIVPFYQPVVSRENGRISGVEVLARWKDPSGTLISPEIFIPLAEQSGLIIPMTDLLMKQVAKDLAPVIDRFIQPFHIAINISVAHTHKNDFINDCRQLLSHFPENSVHLVVEITEREPFEATPNLKDMLSKLRINGIAIALDDFGTGYSNLLYLNELPIDFIKIDKSFVSRINCEPDSNILIDCVVSMANKLKIQIIAEGVETSFQANYLAEKEVSYFQGFYFSRPLSCNDFIREFVLASDKDKVHLKPMST